MKICLLDIAAVSGLSALAQRNRSGDEAASRSLFGVVA